MGNGLSQGAFYFTRNRIRQCGRGLGSTGGLGVREGSDNIDSSSSNGSTLPTLINSLHSTHGLPLATTNSAMVKAPLFLNSIGPKLARQHNCRWDYTGIKCNHTIGDIQTTTDEIIKLTKDINIYKSSSINNISSRIIKDAFLAIPEKVCFLFNLSFNTGIFPRDWKCATIVPLQKEGSKSDVSNLRPVSLLPIPGKLMEKVVHERLLRYFENNNLLEEHQGGFRPGHSTIDSAVTLVDKIFKAMNDREITVATFIDLSKAFDTVNHSILLKKLEYLGVKGLTLLWLTDYISNRVQRTVCNNSTSNPLEVVCGVPQGSVLGPLLFLVYVNDMSSAIGNSSYQLYADDTVVYKAGMNIDEITRQLQEDLVNLSKWCKCNKLTVNIKKTKYVIFGLKSQTKRIKSHSMILDNKTIERVNFYKYLGITLDMHLTFSKHIDNCYRLAAHKIYLLSKIRRYINFQASQMIYKTMVLPYMDYGDLIYDGANYNALERLQTLQNRGLRICINERGYISSVELHQRCRTAMLAPRRLAHLRNFMYKKQECLDLIDSRNIYTRNHAATVYKVAQPSLEKFKQNPLYRGAVDWNNLPVNIRNIPSYNQFKNTQKNWMISGLFAVGD